MLQLLESEDKDLISQISEAEDVLQMIKTISEKNIESDDEGEDGEGEVVALARRSLELLGNTGSQSTGTTLVDG